MSEKDAVNNPLVPDLFSQVRCFHHTFSKPIGKNFSKYKRWLMSLCNDQMGKVTEAQSNFIVDTWKRIHFSEYLIDNAVEGSL